MFRSFPYLITLCILLSSCVDSNQKYNKIKVYTSSNKKQGRDGQSHKKKVLAILPMTGPHKALGREVLNSCLLAIDDYKNIEMILVDSAWINTDPDKVAEIVQRHDIKHIIGPIFGYDLIKMKEIAPYSICFSLSNNYTIANEQNIICGITPSTETIALLNYAANDGLKRILAIVPKNEYGNAINRILDSAKDDNDVYVRKIRYTKFSEEIIEEQLEDTNFDAILICEKVDKITKDYGIPYLVPYRFAKGDIPVRCKAITASPNKQNLDSFKKFFKASFGKEPSDIGIVGYDISNMVFSITVSNYTNSNLFSKRFHGVLGDFDINRKGVIRRNWQIYEWE